MEKEKCKKDEIQCGQIRRWINDSDEEPEFEVLGKKKGTWCYWDVRYLESKIICHYSGGVIASFSKVIGNLNEK